MSENIKELAAEFAKAKSDVQALGDEIKGRMEKGEQNFNALKEQADEALVKMNDIFPRLQELEQKQAREGGEPEGRKSLGALIAAADGVKEIAESTVSGKSCGIHVKATISSLTTDTDGAAGVLVTPDRQGGILAMPERRLTIRDLLAKGTTGSNTITYVRETGFNNNAKAKGEGEAFEYSDLKFTEVETSVKNIGHLLKASKNILADAAQLESFINHRMVYGLKEVEDRQLLNGDGSGQNLKGILPQATAFADPANMAKYTIIDQLRLAALQAALAEYPASGFVLNPVDWAKIELQKDETGRLIIGNPQDGATPRLWRLPVVETVALAGGTFLAGAFTLGAQVFDREEVGVEIATTNQDDFEKNLVTIKCYERLALAVYRPEAFIKGTLAAKTA
ncbi:phage major capsid protein [Neisseria musculi]|uniref:Phage major capsid protein HK97 family n=1 Tax=Neisseria musculi TaxID=1815583 RepID=A0A7H1MEB6_9NEIS|nr:phage major capsid protein [Neisseria musculi]QNT59981.1 phage major capsid protein, HK97 family [Neisseria musculi]